MNAHRVNLLKGCIMNSYLQIILPFFPTASIYKKNEIIIEPKNNIYFRIDNISDILDFDCKMLEWVSRPACKGVNLYWQRYIRRGLNSYFRKSFSKDDWLKIYQRLGNGVNRSLCRQFIISYYNLEVLKDVL